MMTEHQLTAIRNYLLSKKLPIDILIEVNDHFVSQIMDLQNEENLNFEEAFEKVKLKWGNDFIMIRSNFLSKRKIPKILHKIEKQEGKALLQKSFYFALLITILETLSVQFYNKTLYSIIVNTKLFILFSYPFVLLILYSIQQNLRFKNRRKNISIHYYLHPFLAIIIGLISSYFVGFPKDEINIFLNLNDLSKMDGVYVWKMFNKVIASTFYFYAFLVFYTKVVNLIKINKIQLT